MMKAAGQAVVVVGERELRDRLMEAKLQAAINHGLNAHQAIPCSTGPSLVARASVRAKNIYSNHFLKLQLHHQNSSIFNAN
jgi:hypothetical protein